MTTTASHKELWDKALTIALKTGIDIANLELRDYPELAPLLELASAKPPTVRAATGMARYTDDTTTDRREQALPPAPIPSPAASQSRDSNGAVGGRAGAGGEGELPEVPPEVPAEVSPEVSNTSEDFQPKSKKRVCRALKKGTEIRCKAAALAAGDLCIYHEADAITNFSDAQQRGRESHRRRASIITFEELNITLNDRLEFQALTEALLRMMMVGSLPAADASRIIRTLRIVQRNLDVLESHDIPRDHNRYCRALEPCLVSAETIAQVLEDADDFLRAREIEDAAATRREILKANKEFGHNQPKPARTESRYPVPN